MRRYWTIMGVMIASFMLLFLLAEALHIPLLTDPSPWMNRGGVMAALLGVGLLIADVLLPVPSSLVMILHGALFGVWVGTLLSLVGSAGAALFGFALGRRGDPVLARLVCAEERARADRLINRWGALAVLVTRPVPILAETVAIMAGASPLGWGRMTIAALAGSVPAALLYAITGAAAASLRTDVFVFALVILIAGFFWLIARRVEPKHAATESEPS